MENSILGDIGVNFHEYFSVLWRSSVYWEYRHDAWLKGTNIVEKMVQNFKILKNVMLACSLCTSSSECPSGNMCYCDEYKTRLCRCVAERDYGKDDAAPTIFRGFPHNLMYLSVHLEIIL